MKTGVGDAGSCDDRCQRYRAVKDVLRFCASSSRHRTPVCRRSNLRGLWRESVLLDRPPKRFANQYPRRLHGRGQGNSAAISPGGARGRGTRQRTTGAAPALSRKLLWGVHPRSRRPQHRGGLPPQAGVVRLARQRDAAPKRASIARRVLIVSLSVSISTSLQRTTAPWAMSFFSFTRCARPIGSAPAPRLAAAGISLPHTV